MSRLKHLIREIHRRSLTPSVSKGAATPHSPQPGFRPSQHDVFRQDNRDLEDPAVSTGK